MPRSVSTLLMGGARSTSRAAVRYRSSILLWETNAMGFDFTQPCLTHDLAYDLMRYYNRKYDTHDPQARIMADKQFANALQAFCDKQGSGWLAYYERSACRDAATTMPAPSRPPPRGKVTGDATEGPCRRVI